MRSSDNIPCLKCPNFPIVPSIAALEAHGVSRSAIAAATGASRSAISRWAKNGVPAWHQDSIRRLWIEVQHNRLQASVLAAEEVETYDDL